MKILASESTGIVLKKWCNIGIRRSHPRNVFSGWNACAENKDFAHVTHSQTIDLDNFEMSYSHWSFQVGTSRCFECVFRIWLAISISVYPSYIYPALKHIETLTPFASESFAINMLKFHSQFDVPGPAHVVHVFGILRYAAAPMGSNIWDYLSSDQKSSSH